MSPIHFIKKANDDVWGASMVCIYIIYQYENKVRFMSMLNYLIVEIYKDILNKESFFLNITTYVLVKNMTSLKFTQKLRFLLFLRCILENIFAILTHVT